MKTSDYGTAQQLAGIIVEGADAFPGPAFHIIKRASLPGWLLCVLFGKDLRTLCSTRDVSQPRTFSSVDTAIKAAQQIAGIAGCRDNHAWDDDPNALPLLPAISVNVY